MKNYTITVNGNAYDVTVEETGASSAPVAAAPKAAAPAPKAAPAPAAAPAAKAAVAAGAGEKSIDAPMPGKIVKLVASEGQAVKAGDVLLILEAMKMQNEILADCGGTVKAINAQVGANVQAGDTLVIIG